MDSLISFSLAGSGRDAEKAEEKQPRKIDLLNQLLRLAPEGVEKGTYDRCSHPLHSWMCRRAPATTAPAPLEFFPAQSFDNVQILVPEVRATTSSPPTTPEPRKGGWEGADPCTHPFHSWLCAPQRPLVITKETKETPFVPDASVVDQNLLLPPVEPTTTTTTTTLPPSTVAVKSEPEPTTRKPWDGADPCTHAFHSWLCNRNVPPPRPRTAAPTLPPTTTTTPAPAVPDASNNNEFIFFPEPSPPPPTLPLPLPPSTPPPSTTPMLKSGWNEEDSCNHPFHSWLCGRTGRPVKTTTTTTTTTTTPVPTTLRTTPPADDIRFPDASNIAPKEIVPAKPKSGWDGADPCQHPFHSWLCDRSASLGSGRRGRQSPFNQERDEDGFLSHWEPLRISAI